MKANFGDDVLSRTSVVEFYNGKNILITGATGFMGKVLVEKLLRDCPDVNCIYILVRMKRGVSPVQRHLNYVQDVIFERIREVSPVQLKKICLIKGDIAKDNLDIDDEDEAELTKNLDVIFHCAAKAKFSLTLRQALSFNTIGTLRVLQLASRVKHLMVFSHVSTSYCFPQKTILEERYYEPTEDPYRVIELLASKHKADLDDAEPRLMEGFPNTYALSKQLAEALVYSFRTKFPIVVTRPSIVISAWQEPFPGYVESKKNGITGMLLSRGRGLLRTIRTDPDKVFEVMPVDIANNAILAFSCKKALTRGHDVLYSNLTNSGIQNWTWKQYFDYEIAVVRKFPLDLVIWLPHCPLTTNHWYYQYRRLFYHYIPAFVGDIFCACVGQKSVLLLHQKKFDKGMKTMGFYNTRFYDYKNDSLKKLPMELSEKDREIFFCDFKTIDMHECAANVVLGTRKFILKLNDEDSLEIRRGLMMLFFFIDLVARLIFSAILILVIFLLFFFIFDQDLFYEKFADMFYSAKYMFSNNFVVPRNISCPLDI